MVSSVKARVIESGAAGPMYRRLRLAAPGVAGPAQPGQFVHLRCAPPDAFDPLLRRPLSLHRIDPAGEWIEVLFRVVGRGTSYLAGLQPGDPADLLGPLGRGFPMSLEPGQKPVIVGGGIGAAPLAALAEGLARQGTPALAVIGAQTASALAALAVFEKAADEVIVTTDDGSSGRPGFVTGPLADVLKDRPGMVVYACGPEPMLKRVQAMTVGRPAYLSLETRMACGVGACLGCVVRAAAPGALEGAEPHYHRVCHDGPVFAAGEVVIGG